jgi:hypothetical protein
MQFRLVWQKVQNVIRDRSRDVCAQTCSNFKGVLIMNRIYCAGIVGLALLMSGAAARAHDFGDGTNYGLSDYHCNSHDGKDYSFNFKPCDDNGYCQSDSCTNNSNDDSCGGGNQDNWGGGDDCHHHDHCGCDPVAVPLPAASSLGGAGLLMAAAAKWLRSRRTTIA